MLPRRALKWPLSTKERMSANGFARASTSRALSSQYSWLFLSKPIYVWVLGKQIQTTLSKRDHTSLWNKPGNKKDPKVQFCKSFFLSYSSVSAYSEPVRTPIPFTWYGSTWGLRLLTSGPGLRGRAGKQDRGLHGCSHQAWRDRIKYFN